MDTTKDWQFGKMLPDRINHMLQNELMCDVTFYVGDNQTPIKAHKFMMASASPVFYSMFEGPLAEQGDVSITDVEANIFRDILKYIYTDSIEIDATNIHGLLHVSDKYMLHNIKDECSHYLQSNLDKECACVVLQTAHVFHLADLQTNALMFILNSGKPCLESNSFLSLSRECLKLVIESDYLACEEEIIYQKMIEWSTNRCQDEGLTVNDNNIRQVLGDFLHFVRFPIMERRYFTENVSKKSLLSSDQIINVYQSFDDKENAEFPTKSRNVKYWVCLRCKTGNSGESTDDFLDFTVSHACIMLGIKVFGSTTYSGKHDISLTILKSSVVLTSKKTVLYSKKGQEMYPVMFDKPLNLENDTNYTIQLNMKGHKTFTGESYRSSVSMLESDGCGPHVTFFDYSHYSRKSSTSEDRGQIPGIIIQLQNNDIFMRNRLYY